MKLVWLTKSTMKIRQKQPPESFPVKKTFLKFSQNSQERTGANVSF